MKKFFSLSLLSHLFLLMSFALYCSTIKIKTQTMYSMPAYVISSAISTHYSAVSSQDRKAHGHEHPEYRKPLIQSSSGNNHMQNKAKNNSTERILLEILHNAIAANLIYPESALLLNQNGTVKIGLTLFPNGQITQVAMLKSSGIESMDKAAIAAVQSIAVIEEARRYLSTKEFFSVDVVFQT